MKKALILASVPSMLQQFNIANMQILKENGYEVQLAANFNIGGTIDQEELTKFKKDLKKMGIKYNNILFNRNPFSLKNIQAYKQLKELFKNENYDIIHLQSPIGAACGRLAAREYRKNGTRVIYTAHGFHFFKGAPLINWIMFYPVEKWLSKYTDTLITINTEDYELAKKKFKTEDIQFVHGVGLDEEKFKIEITEEHKERLRRELEIKKDDIVFTYVAELNKNKNQELLIETMKRLKDDEKQVKLLLIGKGPLEEEYKKLIEKLDLQKEVKLLGYRKDITQLLSITDIYLASSLREGLPVNIMEAMYIGIPIVALDNRGHRELIEDNENGYIIKQNKEVGTNFYSQILELMEDKKKRKKISVNSKKKVKNYVMSNVIKEMKKIYF